MISFGQGRYRSKNILPKLPESHNMRNSLNICIPTIQDHFFDLRSSQLDISKFKIQSQQQTFQQDYITTPNALKSVQFLLMDFFYSSKLLMFSEIKTFVQNKQLQIRANMSIDFQLRRFDIEKYYQQTLIKKIFSQYLEKISSGGRNLEILKSCPIVKPIIEIVMINYLHSRLPAQKFEDFYKMYMEQTITAQKIFTIIAKVFVLQFFKHGEDQYELRFEKNSISIKKSGSRFMSKIK